MDTSKPARGILASLEHRTPAPAQRALPTKTRGPAAAVAIVAAAGLAAAVLLAWWMLNGPSPLVVQETLHVTMPVPAEVLPAAPAVEEAQAAIIVNDPPAPTQTAQQVVAAALASTPIATIVAPRERSQAPRKPHPKPVARQPAKQPVPAPAKPASPAQDSDVALLAALVAHANAGGRRRADHVVGNAAEHLKQCASLGGSEGDACRARVCGATSGDAACGVTAPGR